MSRVAAPEVGRLWHEIHAVQAKPYLRLQKRGKRDAAVPGPLEPKRGQVALMAYLISPGYPFSHSSNHT